MTTLAVLTGRRRLRRLSSFDKEFVTSLLHIGAMVGAFFAEEVADRIVRHRTRTCRLVTDQRDLSGRHQTPG